jgi:hypothetical protein
MKETIDWKDRARVMLSDAINYDTKKCPPGGMRMFDNGYWQGVRDAINELHPEIELDWREINVKPEAGDDTPTLPEDAA